MLFSNFMTGMFFYILTAVLFIFSGTWLSGAAGVVSSVYVPESVPQLDEFITETLMVEPIAVDPFGSDGTGKILLIGEDSRVGVSVGHCDAIQFLEIDKGNSIIKITAVPRGTFSTLPGGGHAPSDYYVSNACQIGGLAYGVEQIEKILGQKADYVVRLGFSGAMGVLRRLDLPATESLAWLRNRHGFALGEPQRAHNHSAFIKKILVEYAGGEAGKRDVVWQYLIFRLFKTDLTFGQVRQIAEAFSGFDLAEHPERVRLFMRPAYQVVDIDYDTAHLDEKRQALLAPVIALLSTEDYAGVTQEQGQAKLLATIQNGLDSGDFVSWAFENSLWMQIDNETDRENAHFVLLQKHIETLVDKDEAIRLTAEYIQEMEYLGLSAWAERGREMAARFVEKK